MKFIGHLDIMRFFQKVMRRADIPIAFSGGYSPHMIMSFANPLGVGVTSDGEYFDIELAEDIDMNLWLIHECFGFFLPVCWKFTMSK